MSNGKKTDPVPVPVPDPDKEKEKEREEKDVAARGFTGGKTPMPVVVKDGKVEKETDGSYKIDKEKFNKCQYTDKKVKSCKNEAIIHTKKKEHLCVEHYRLLYDTEHAELGKKKRNKLGHIKVTVGMIFPEEKK